MANVKFLTGSKEKVDEQITSGKADAGDVIFTSDTDELIFISPQTEKRVIKSKTQQSYTLNGVELGGLKDGSVIKEGIDIDDLLAMITTRIIPATYQKPELLLASNLNKFEYEVGEIIQSSFQSQFVQNDAGALTAHSITKNGQVVVSENADFLSANIEIAISDEIVSFESQAMYQAGEIKNDNLGEPSPEGAIAAGSMMTDTIVFNGYRNVFYGTGDGELPEINSENIRNLQHSLLNPNKDTEFIVDMAVNEQYAIIAYPTFLGDAKITYIQMNDDEMASSFTQTIAQVNGANGYEAIDYKIYIYKTDVPVPSKVSFKVEF